ncbi:MAG: STAS domain-containing protein [Sneathiella sp.]
MAKQRKTVKDGQEPIIIKLDPILDLNMAAALHSNFSKALDEERPISVDTADVEKITTPCLQIMISAGLSSEAAGNSFSFNDPSEALSNAFHDLGLHSFLNRWSNV